MCLLIHKPSCAELPEQLLESAAEFNPHGYGFIGFGPDGSCVVRRSEVTDLPELRQLYEAFRGRECVIHLRYGTSGNIDFLNTHPIQVTDTLYLAHNGTLNMQRHDHERSDTWHLVNDYLEPMLRKRPELLHDTFFHQLLSTWCGPQNRFVFIDSASAKVLIINREQGFELDGVWLSNTRWFDASRFAWHPARRAAQAAGMVAAFSI